MQQNAARTARKPISHRGRAAALQRGRPADHDLLAPALVPGVDAGASATRGDAGEIERLFLALGHVSRERNPRTARLLEAKVRKVAQKVIEEAGEVAIEAMRRNPRGVTRESADLLYQLTVLWRRAGIEPGDVWEEMRQRAAVLGIAEKLPKSRGCKSRESDSPND